LLAGCSLLFAAGGAAAQAQEKPAPAGKPKEGKTVEKTVAPATVAPGTVAPAGVAGAYLSSYFAQSSEDWDGAATYLLNVLRRDPGNTDLAKRSMILAAGSGNIDMAAAQAKKLFDAGDHDSLNIVLLAVKAVTDQDYKTAQSYLDRMPKGEMTVFVKPLMEGWAMAGQGKYYDRPLDQTTIHMYHKGLMALYLNRQNDVLKAAHDILDHNEISFFELERTADLLAAAGEYKEAAELYQKIIEREPENMDIAAKEDAAKKKDAKKLSSLLAPLPIRSAQQGASQALYDVALVLSQEQNPTTTRLFSQLSLTLDPSMIDARLLLADSLVKTGRYKEAIAQIDSVPENHPAYLETQRFAAELQVEAGDSDGAKQRLSRLFAKYDDVKALIQMGDLARQQENYGAALQLYNQAIGTFGGKLPDEYWYVLYARGMAYEREGKWPQAESDLKAALSYQPNHPYLLNYLGYGWAEQGLQLDKSLELINRAVAILPQDGYIRDSLGWVYYMKGDYEQAVPHLEKAVELLPYDMTVNDPLGDAYWRVGRKTEARYQWERARGNAETDEDRLALGKKLETGLEATGLASTKTERPGGTLFIKE